MTNKAKAHNRLCCLFHILLIALLFSSTYNASAVSYSLPKTRTPTPTNSPYPPVETSTIPTPDTLQSYKVFLPLVEAELLYTQSYYMKTVDANILYNLGCDLGLRDTSLPGKQNSIIILDFGYPLYNGNEYGTIIFDYSFASTTEIGNAVIDFSTGYHHCSNELSYLIIAVGTNNCGPGYCTDSEVTFQHGEAWALMVNKVNGDLEEEEYFEILAMGASDIEIAWNSPGVTRDWVEGYDSVNSYSLYYYGDAQGCPTYRTFGANIYCDNGWYMDDVWYLAFGAGFNKPFPLIYATGGENADQWYSLSAYAYERYGRRMDIKGSVTQYQACIQTGYTWCQENYVNNTPAQGYTQLLYALNSNPDTAQNLLWATDMAWQE